MVALIGKGKKSKAISVRGRGGPYGCETSRLPYFLDNPEICITSDMVAIVIIMTISVAWLIVISNVTFKI
jgi:hypothetical protein